MFHPRLPILVALCAALAACARPAPPASAPSSAPSAPRATAKPVAAKTHAPAASEPRATAAAATPSPTPSPRAVMLGPNAPPRIIAISMRPARVHPGDTLSGSVTASSNVASVEVRIGGYGMGMQKIGVGRFALSYVVPNVPFLHGTFVAQVIARNTGGVSVERSVPIEIW